MEFDPFLYVAFVLGLLAGRLRPVRSPWVNRVTLGAVVVLIAFLGANLASAPLGGLLDVVPTAVIFVLVLLVATAGVARAFSGRSRGRAVAIVGPRPSRWIGLVFVGALLGGFALGRAVPFDATDALRFSLYALLALVGYALQWNFTALRRLWVPVAASLVGATVAAAVAVAFLRVPPAPSFATAYGFGFYSLAGPVVTTHAGAALGFLAFLTNFLRENLTMEVSPLLGPWLGGEGVAAIGGATSMDTTLYFVTRYGDAAAGSLALASGLILTILASVAVPLLMSLPGA